MLRGGNPSAPSGQLPLHKGSSVTPAGGAIPIFPCSESDRATNGRPQFVKKVISLQISVHGAPENKLIGTALLQRLHQSLHRRRTSTLRRIATSRFLYQAIRRNGDVPYAAAYRTSMVPTGSGGIAFSILPGGFRFLSPRRKEHVTEPYSYGNVHNSILNGSVSRWLPQSLRDSSLPEGASCTPMRLCCTEAPTGTPSVIR